MRIPDPTLIQASNLAPAPVPAQPPPTAAPVPVTPPPKVGADLLHLSAHAAALAAGDADTASLRQMLVSGLLQLLAGDHAFTSGVTIADTPSAAPAAAPATTQAATQDDGAGDLRLRLSLAVIAADGSRMPMRAELVLHAGILRYAPALVAAMAESPLGASAGLPVIQLPLAQLPPPQLLGFHLLLNPAALWPLSVTIAGGLLRLTGPQEATDTAEEEDERPVGTLVRDWLDLHRRRMAQR